MALQQGFCDASWTEVAVDLERSWRTCVEERLAVGVIDEQGVQAALHQRRVKRPGRKGYSPGARPACVTAPVGKTSRYRFLGCLECRLVRSRYLVTGIQSKQGRPMTMARLSFFVVFDLLYDAAERVDPKRRELRPHFLELSCELSVLNA